MKSTDRNLLDLLGANARTSISDLARAVGVSRTTVTERIARMERAGVISGYTIRTGPGLDEAALTAFVAIVVDPKFATRVINRLRGIDELRAIWTVSGRYDVMAQVGVATTADIDGILDVIGQIDGVARTESSIVLSTRLDRRPVGVVDSQPA